MKNFFNLFKCYPRKIRYKIVINGDSKVGKTRFITMLENINKEKPIDKNHFYEPSVGTYISILNFKFKNKNVSFSVWDCAGELKYSGLKEGYYNNTDCFIIMINKNTTRESYEKMIKEYHKKNLMIKSNNKILIIYVRSNDELEVNDRFAQIEKIVINFNDEVSIRNAFESIKIRNLN